MVYIRRVTIVFLLIFIHELLHAIAFPKNASAVCPMSKAPSPVDQLQLDDLGIEVKEDE